MPQEINTLAGSPPLIVQESDIFEVLRTARTIRRLKSDPVPSEYIDRMLWAAQRAANGSNSQPARFLVIDDPEKKQKLQELYKVGWDDYVSTTNARFNAKPRSEEARVALQRGLSAGQHIADHLHEAPYLIMACTVGAAGSGGSVFPAIQNLILAGRALGLATSLTTILRRFQDETRAILGIPEEASYLCLIPVGWPLYGKFGEGERLPVEEVTYANEWGVARKPGTAAVTS